jgi:hypothetical protein
MLISWAQAHWSAIQHRNLTATVITGGNPNTLYYRCLFMHSLIKVFGNGTIATCYELKIVILHSSSRQLQRSFESFLVMQLDTIYTNE